MDKNFKLYAEAVKNKIRDNIIEEQKQKSKIYFISDTHFGDDRLNLYGRDLAFKNSKEFDEYIVKKCNEAISKNDVLYHLGDVSLTADGLENIKKINCRKKILIKGNYDISEDDGGTCKFQVNDKILLKYFDEVHNDLEIKIDDEKIYLNHFPINSKPDVFNLCGHIHGLWKVQRNSVNVGCDAWHFCPVSEDVVKFQINGVKKYYDQNVFAGELVVNVENKKGDVKILRAPEYIDVVDSENNRDVFVFFAGPAQGCENWQEYFLEHTKDQLKDLKTNKNIVLCSPRRVEKPKNFSYEEQVGWESFHLDKASRNGFIVFWLAKETEKIDGRSFARTSRFEIGEWFSVLKEKQISIIIGYEKGFDGTEYIEHKFKTIDENFELIKSKEEMIKTITNKIKEIS
ncbi:MAG: hypothetical protein WC466_02880 [Candidatus Izemoplasmatales bacterium]